MKIADGRSPPRRSWKRRRAFVLLALSVVACSGARAPARDSEPERLDVGADSSFDRDSVSEAAFSDAGSDVLTIDSDVSMDAVSVGDASPDGCGEAGTSMSDGSCIWSGTPGDCGACPYGPFSTPTCVCGRCGLLCAAAHGNCDGDPANGCEADLTQPAACGSCANDCLTMSIAGCSWQPDGAMCGVDCPSGTTRCGSQCTNLSSDPNHCGTSCATRQLCPAPTFGTAACTGGACNFMCYCGYHPCASACVSDADATHCGASCVACAPGTTCVAGACR